jgi:hypothetical protein
VGKAFVAFALPFWLLWIAVLLTQDPAKDDISTDFVVYWGASSLTLDGQPGAAYDEQRLAERRFQVAGESKDVWLYPPMALLFVLPLGLLPLGLALAGWAGVTGAVALSAARRVWQEPSVPWLAVAFPATLYNLILGQSGLLTAGLFAWGLLLLHSRPLGAGGIFGLMAFKPHLFPLVLLALLAGGRRSAAAGAVAAAGGLALVSLAAFGPGTWEAFLNTIPDTTARLYDGVTPLRKMQSLTAAMLLLGSGRLAAQAAQAAVTIAVAAFVVWLWRRDAPFELKAAGLGLAILLATPYAYHYDLTILGVAMLWYGRWAQQAGWQTWDREALVLAWWAPLIALVLGSAAHLVVAPLVLAALLALVARRASAPEATPGAVRRTPQLAA